jgi:hypothetical protein
MSNPNKDKINEIKKDIETLKRISIEDESNIKRLKGYMHDYPIKRYKSIHVNFSPYDPMLGSSEETYATYLFVKKHKNEVDKELHKKKSELRNLNITKEDKRNDNKF